MTTPPQDGQHYPTQGSGPAGAQPPAGYQPPGYSDPASGAEPTSEPRRTGLIVGVALGVILLVGVLIAVLFATGAFDDDAEPGQTAPAATEPAEEEGTAPQQPHGAYPAAGTDEGGFILTAPDELAAGAAPEGPVHVVTYTDAGCPACGNFESTFHDQLEGWLAAGDIALEYRSMNWIRPPYSGDAANAFACMAEEAPEHYLEFLGSITAEQDGGFQLQKQGLAERAEQDYGVNITDCVDEDRYADFVAGAGEHGLAQGIAGTPTVIINGEEVPAAELGATDRHIEEAIAAQ